MAENRNIDRSGGNKVWCSYDYENSVFQMTSDQRNAHFRNWSEKLNDTEIQKIERLNLYGDELTQLSPNFGNQFNHISGLFLSQNNLKSLPLSIGNLTNLKSLHLNNNNLQSLPKSIIHLTNLEFLCLLGNESIPCYLKHYGFSGLNILDRYKKEMTK